MPHERQIRVVFVFLAWASEKRLVFLTRPHAVQMQHWRGRPRGMVASIMVCERIARALLLGAARLAAVAKVWKDLETSLTARWEEAGTLCMISRTISIGSEVMGMGMLPVAVVVVWLADMFMSWVVVGGGEMWLRLRVASGGDGGGGGCWVLVVDTAAGKCC